MIVMINGSFGVGKTSTAEALLATWPNAMIYDPEMVGALTRAITEGIRTPEEETHDFQDINLWRPLVVATAQHLARQYKRPLIVPITLANPAYLDEIEQGFQAFDPDVHHFCLIASLPTVKNRLIERGDNEQVKAWCFNKAAQYVPMFGSSRYAEHIDTETMRPPEIASYILKTIGVN